MREGFTILESLNDALWVLPILAQVVVAVQLLVTGGWRRQRLLVCLSIAMPLAVAIGNLIHGSISAAAYSRFWIVAYLLVASLVALALTEACSRSLQAYERFAEAGNRIIRAILIVSALAILATLFIMADSTARRFWPYVQTQAYLVQGSLALLGAAILIFARWARLRLGYNARLTVIVLTTSCAMDGLLGSGISASWGSLNFLLGILLSTACWLYLALRWSSRGDPPRIQPRASSTVDIAPALARMASTSRDLADLVRRG